ncbi:MAG TPA: hypothetical protein GX497_13810 [Bacillus bacterium]|nr:hypothetical protein [Bacillus sp. (in: firmicutes)]
MKIADFKINMNSERIFNESKISKTTMKKVLVKPNQKQLLQPVQNHASQLKQVAEKMVNKHKEMTTEYRSEYLHLSKKDQLRLQLIDILFPKLFKGKKLNLQVPEQILISNAIQMPPTQTVIENYERTYRYEEVSFSAEGKILTEDGKEINFTVDINMSRELYQESYSEVTIGSFVDPLIINFNGTAAELSDRTFKFDLTSNGTMVDIPYLYPGSGFLALDKNGDNIINNGLELFGTQSGNGFKDLAAYDDDHNGWIDENDAIFHHLRIWTKDENGNDQLFAIAEKGIGAIFLGHMPTQFSLFSSDQQEQAQIRSTGIFLFEDGRTGSIQHLDFKI